jgi:hypothetical protein
MLSLGLANGASPAEIALSMRSPPVLCSHASCDMCGWLLQCTTNNSTSNAKQKKSGLHVRWRDVCVRIFLLFETTHETNEPSYYYIKLLYASSYCLKLLYMCPHTASNCYICVLIRPQNARYVSSYCLKMLCMCPHIASNCHVCVLIRPYTAIYVSSYCLKLPCVYLMLPHTATYVSSSYGCH